MEQQHKRSGILMFLRSFPFDNNNNIIIFVAFLFTAIVVSLNFLIFSLSRKPKLNKQPKPNLNQN
jgi:hypothetical protein